MRQLIIPKELRSYLLPSGTNPFSRWLHDIADVRTRIRIRTRLDRLALGHYGDYKILGEGICELKLNFGPGYRIYFGELEEHIILLLDGGDKSSQVRDIAKVKTYWQQVKAGNYIYE